MDLDYCKGCFDCTKPSPLFNQLGEEDLSDLNEKRYEVLYSAG